MLSQSSDQYSQELRLTSYLPGNFNFTAGGYWMDFEQATRSTFFVPELSFLGQFLGIPGENQTFDFFTPELLER